MGKFLDAKSMQTVIRGMKVQNEQFADKYSTKDDPYYVGYNAALNHVSEYIENARGVDATFFEPVAISLQEKNRELWLMWGELKDTIEYMEKQYPEALDQFNFSEYMFDLESKYRKGGYADEP